MNARFGQYVSRVAFNLSLSNNQIVSLVEIANRDMLHDAKKNGLVTHDTTVPTRHALSRKGLVEYAPDAEDSTLGYRLTNAGRLTIEMLREAGLVQHIEDVQRANGYGPGFANKRRSPTNA